MCCLVNHVLSVSGSASAWWLFLKKMHLGIQGWEQNRCWTYPIWNESCSLLLLPGWAPHRAVSAWLNMSIYTHLAPLMRANLPWTDFGTPWNLISSLLKPWTVFQGFWLPFLSMQSTFLSTAGAPCVGADGSCGAKGHKSARWCPGDCGGLCLLPASQRNTDYYRFDTKILQ